MIRYAATILSSGLGHFWTLRARAQFLVRGVDWPINFRVQGPMGLSAEGHISIGDNVTIVNSSKYNRAGVNHPTQLVASRGASLTIGNSSGISGASIYAMESIKIGKHVLVGANCHIYDTDFHPIDWQQRRASGAPATAPIKIEDDVWLAANVTILKGVTIGARSVIAAGSVVASDIPSDVLAGGVPAKVIKPIKAS